ncbi:MAG: hypothetical protein R3300_09260 [Candidatus Promineifilaceae bacterium]|nr:hypothetical protein [Candidatus Promineifilaceae bacterium]
MNQLLVVFIAAVAVAHGIVHLLGFIAYWPLATLRELPYKTELLGGRWQLSPLAMRLYSVLWLLAAVGFILSGAGLVLRQPWWPNAMLTTSVLSLIVGLLDLEQAWIGVLIDILAVAFAIVGPNLLA